jgi:hypothetical protein
VTTADLAVPDQSTGPPSALIKVALAAKPAAKTSDISFLAENFIKFTSFRYKI